MEIYKTPQLMADEYMHTNTHMYLKNINIKHNYGMWTGKETALRFK